MIYTLTLNPCIDIVMELNELNIGKTNRIIKENKFPGGKGINVSLVLNQLKLDNIALGFIGGNVGESIINYLNKAKINHNFINIKDESRTNFKLKIDNEITEINGIGPKITKTELNKLYKQLDQLNENDLLILSGSISPSLPKHIYEIIMKRVSNNNVKCILDTSGKELLNALKYKPFLIKPNKEELEELFDVKLNRHYDFIHYAKKLVDMGASNVIVSLGEKGAIFTNENEIYMFNAPDGDVNYSVGAGDAMVAGFVYEYTRTNNLYNAIYFAVACGSAKAFSEYLFDLDDVASLMDKFEMQKID